MKDLESKDLWIQARIDELLCDNLWCISIAEQFDKDAEAPVFFNDYIRFKAKQQATREHAEIEAMILNAQIDNLELG